MSEWLTYGFRTVPQQQSLPLPPTPQKPYPDLAVSSPPQAPHGDIVEDKERQRQILSDETAEVDREIGELFTERTRELAERRAAAIGAVTAAVNADHDVIEQREFALLRQIEALKKRKIQRALDGLDR